MKAKALNAVATVLVLALVAAALPLTVPKLFGYQIFEILTTSMTPVLPVGSAIYVKACDPAQLEPGDIITYKLSSRTGLVGGERHSQPRAGDKGRRKRPGGCLPSGLRPSDRPGGIQHPLLGTNGDSSATAERDRNLRSNICFGACSMDSCRPREIQTRQYGAARSRKESIRESFT